MKKVMFLSSTGGHLDELMQLKTMFENYDYYIVTEKDKSTKNLKKLYGNRLSYLIYGNRRKIFVYPFSFLFNCIKSLFLLIKIRPKYIVTTGAHVAVAMCYLAKLLGIKTIFIETFANRTGKSLTGRLVYPVVNLFIVQWEEMLQIYPKAVFGGSIYK